MPLNCAIFESSAGQFRCSPNLAFAPRPANHAEVVLDVVHLFLNGLRCAEDTEVDCKGCPESNKIVGDSLGK